MKNRVTWKGFIQFFCLAAVFLVSVQIRSFNFNQPLGRHHEWITAHTLITLKIWEHGGGPDAYKFSPVYSFHNNADKNIATLGGVIDDKGNAYYISYPPFAFLLPYYTIKLSGAAFNTDSLLVFSLVLHFLIAVGLFLLIMVIAGKNGNHEFYFPAWTGFILYCFASGNLWFHSNVYFVDMLMQLFIVLQLFVYYKIDAGSVSKGGKWLSVAAIITFLAVYTEWMGLLLAFCFGTLCFIKWLISRNKRYLLNGSVIAVFSSLSLVFTFMQYSSVAGSERLINSAVAKYNLRSGLQGENASEAGYSIGNPESYTYLQEHFQKNYADIFQLLCWSILFFLVLVFLKKRYLFTSVQVFVILLLVSASALHYFLFFNFNALHDFSTLKISILFILLIVFISDRFIFFLREKAGRLLTYFIIIFSLALTWTAYSSYNAYISENSLEKVTLSNRNIGEAVYHHARPEEMVFINRMVNPETMYYAGRNILQANDTESCIEKLHQYREEKGIFFFSSDDELEKIIRVNKNGAIEPVFSRKKNEFK